jgi:hypothetical protein
MDAAERPVNLLENGGNTMKRIDWTEIVKDAGVKDIKLDKVYEHTASSNDEEITIITRLERAHIYLGQLKQLGQGRYEIFRAMRDKAKKFDGMITIYRKGGEHFVLALCTNGQLTIQ